jgi:hypothetical protein
VSSSTTWLENSIIRKRTADKMIHDLLPDIKTLFGPVAFVIGLSPLLFNILLYFVFRWEFFFLYSL